MGNVKYSDETVKYRIHATLDIDGVANESDIVGALFGQTEGLLEQDMELKSLQRTGRIGRIDLKISNKSGNTVGKITVPSSLNKVETAIIAATLETVDRVGACSCNIVLDKIVDVRKDKREEIAKRAAEIMKKWDIDTQSKKVDISAIVEKDAKRGRIVRFGFEKLAAGPGIYKSDDIILVEGRADVSNLLKMNIENTIALGGTSVPDTVKNLCKSRTVTVLLDGDRGGDMILKELLLATPIEYVARAPHNREVEHLNIDEVRNTLDQKVNVLDAEFITENINAYEFLKRNKRFDYIDKAKAAQRNGLKQAKSYRKSSKKRGKRHGKDRDKRSKSKKRGKRRDKDKSYDKSRKKSRKPRFPRPRRGRSKHRREKIKIPKQINSIIEETKETTNAVFIDNSHEKLLTVSSKDVFNRLASLPDQGINAIVIDGVITQRLLSLADEKSIKLVAGAVLGDIQDKPKVTQYVTFNRI